MDAQSLVCVLDSENKVHIGRIIENVFISMCGFKNLAVDIGNTIKFIGTYEAIANSLKLGPQDGSLFWCRKCWNIFSECFK